MISLKNILTISKYESKILWRNWFFRILAIAGVLFVTAFNIGIFSQVDTPRWHVLANSWIQPSTMLIMISIPQAAAIIFLASGMVKKDKKLDTNEVFYVRPISNLDFVLGKALAIIKLFMLLNLALLLIPVIVNFTNPTATFNVQAFLIFPLLISLPTLVFTTGLAFLLVTLLKNQPITIVLLLGIAGVELIYYFDKFSNILDFLAFRLSVLPSEMIGFVDLEFILFQRGFYFLSGLGLLFATAFFLNRLSSHWRIKLFTGIFSLFIISASALMMFHLWELHNQPLRLRKQLIEKNNEMAGTPNADVVANTLLVEFKDSQLRATSHIRVRNNKSMELSSIYFTLNPGLSVSEVKKGSTVIPFEQELQIVHLKEEINIPPASELSITITYSGSILNDAANLEVSQERYEEADDYFVYSLPKKPGFLVEDYALLTNDFGWYPDTKLGYSTTSASRDHQQFIEFELTVTPPEGLLPVSQGALTQNGNSFHFKPEYPLPQLSLAIGNYRKKEIIIDSIHYSVYHYPGNDYFVNKLDLLSDTLDYLITDIVNEYEEAQQLKYPFKRLQFVEVPIQFMAFDKIYQSHQAYLQPETVYYPEEGGNIRQFDFDRQMADMNRQTRRENQVLSEKQKQANVFNDLIKKVFTKQASEDWFFDGRDGDEPDYAIFPNYYTFNSGVVSPDWSILNRSIATYLRNDQQGSYDFSRNANGISFTEECNELMREASFDKILTDEEFNKIKKSISLKSEYLFAYLGQLVGNENFKSFLYEWVNTHQHQLTTFQELREGVIHRFDLDIEPIIQKVYGETDQPAFEILEVQKYEVLDGDRKRYQVLLTIRNSGKNDGVVEVKFNMDDNSNSPFFFNRRVNDEPQEQVVGHLSIIPQNEIKQLGFILDEKPQDITVNTIISRNIPSVITISVGTLKEQKNGNLFEGERVLSQYNNEAEGEIIVDNEDDNFSTFSPVKPTYLRAYLDSRNPSDRKYYGNWYRSYSKWLATTGSDFYGTVIRSSHFTRSGSGEKIATWTPKLDEEGFYDVYVHLRGKNQNQVNGNDNDGNYNYRYIVTHEDGEDRITYNLANAEPGWNYLGTYYFDKNNGNISLTDECELPTVYADAIKWVKQ